MTDMADINEDISINRAALGAYIDHIAVFDRLEEIKPLSLPVKVDFILSILCEHGTLTIDYDSTSCHLTERSLMVMRPGHTLKSYSASSDFKGHMIVVSTKLLGNTIPALSKVIPCLVQFKDNPAIKLTPEEVAGQTGLRALLRNKTSVKNHPYCDDVVRSLLEAMFYETLGLYSTYTPSLSNPISMKRRDELLYRFIQAVEKHYATERSVAFYADMLCVTPKHLSATIKETSGRTAGEWIDSYVIIEAKTLLRNTGLTIQEVSAKLNFSNQSFFGKYFKHITGISPRRYRSSLEP
ncbi:AraC family transcriptional regulator [bacterium J10(2018)]|jgi:AraC-like DNA-binding protein|nr:AraC family transcriptional regulator [bacterium J10(2018)]